MIAIFLVQHDIIFRSFVQINGTARLNTCDALGMQWGMHKNTLNQKYRRISDLKTQNTGGRKAKVSEKRLFCG